jgi:hypothetical protein
MCCSTALPIFLHLHGVLFFESLCQLNKRRSVTQKRTKPWVATRTIGKSSDFFALSIHFLMEDTKSKLLTTLQYSAENYLLVSHVETDDESFSPFDPLQSVTMKFKVPNVISLRFQIIRSSCVEYFQVGNCFQKSYPFVFCALEKSYFSWTRRWLCLYRWCIESCVLSMNKTCHKRTLSNSFISDYALTKQISFGNSNVVRSFAIPPLGIDTEVLNSCPSHEVSIFNHWDKLIQVPLFKTSNCLITPEKGNKNGDNVVLNPNGSVCCRYILGSKNEVGCHLTDTQGWWFPTPFPNVGQFR